MEGWPRIKAQGQGRAGRQPAGHRSWWLGLRTKAGVATAGKGSEKQRGWRFRPEPMGKLCGGMSWPCFKTRLDLVLDERGGVHEAVPV